MADPVWEWTLLDAAKRFVARRTGIGDKDRIVQCLLNEPCNVSVVGRHLRQLRAIDFPNGSGSPGQIIRITGTRYNRGPNLSLEQILLNTSYGDFILKIQPRLTGLLA